MNLIKNILIKIRAPKKRCSHFYAEHGISLLYESFYLFHIGSIYSLINFILSSILGLKYEAIIITIFSLGLMYITLPPSPKAANECSSLSIIHHNKPYFKSFQLLFSSVLS